MPSTPACILVVEDHEDGHVVLEMQLRHMGYSVVGVATYEEAITQAKENHLISICSITG